MSRLIFPWKRFWYPRESTISLVDDGFLVDPESEYGKYYHKDVAPFDAIANSPCLVLLGEPGIGKSTALKEDFEAVKKTTEATGDIALFFDLRDYSSDERLERKVFKNSDLQAWHAGDWVLHLFLDSLDEGLSRIGNISQVILSELQALPANRLRLRIASRPADWQGSLEEGFRKFWGAANVNVFSLAPLRKRDAESAATAAGLDAESFVKALILSDVVPLAIKPVTLEFLLTTFSKNGTFPSRRTELYLEGCRRLCEESSESRNDSPKARPRLSTSQRMAVASRLASLSQLSNHSGFWMGRQAGLEPQDLAIELAVGGTEGFDATEITVDINGIREVLDTGLFSSSALSRQNWRHQTYAEYLAAFYLNTNEVDPGRLRSLFMHPDGSNKVIPQLRETASWLASLNTEFFRMVARFDPEVVLRSDMGSAGPTDRADLTRNLLQYFGQGGVLESIWDLHSSFARLANPELLDIVRPYLLDKSHPKDSRIVAIEIAGACGLTEVEAELIAILSDADEHESIRQHAMSVLDETGSNAAIPALKFLAFGECGEDPNDKFRGSALDALWPDNLSAKELFEHLPPPKDEHDFGPYSRFLKSGVAGALQSQDIPLALRWARTNPGGWDESSPVRKLSTEILERAIDYIDEPGVIELLAAALMERARQFLNYEPIKKKLRSMGDGPRRAFAHTLFDEAVGVSHGAYAVIDICGIGSGDVPWLLGELGQAEEGEVQRLISEVIARHLEKASIPDFDAVLAAASLNPALNMAISPLVTAIELNSPLAALLKAEYARLGLAQQAKAVPQQMLFDQELSAALSDAAPARYFRLRQLLHIYKKKSPEVLNPLPGWSELAPGVQSAIMTGAREYLKLRPPFPSESGKKDGHFSYAMIAGSNALHLLSVESPDSLNTLSDDDWQFWTQMVVAYRDDSTKARQLVVETAFARARIEFIAALEEVIEAEDARFGRIMVLRGIDAVWSEDIAAMLRAKLDKLKPTAFKDVIAVLLKKGDAPTKKLARGMVKPGAPQGDSRQRALFAAAELLAHDAEEWSILQPIFWDHSSFGVEVLQLTASEQKYSSFAHHISPSEVVDLCIWLAGMGLEKGQPDPHNCGLITPTVALSQWWNILVNSVVSRGTRDACNALARLVAALPEYNDGLRDSLRRAEELTRRASWEAPTPKQVLEMARYDRVLRLVISVHGIHTRGAWQKEVNPYLQKKGFLHELLDYGNYWVFQLLIPPVRAKKVEWFRKEYERLTANSNTRPSIIAHSFGTYIVANALLKYPEIIFDRLILCGSIIQRDYAWDLLLNRGQGNAVLNEYGGMDLWVKLAPWLIKNTGASGARGFQCAHPSLYQRMRPRFRHSDYFFALNYKDNWIPFLRGIEPELQATQQVSHPQ